jgi:hypothetical protein
VDHDVNPKLAAIAGEGRRHPIDARIFTRHGHDWCNNTD